MLKKTITYTDFNGEEVSEDFFFHLSQAELVELEMSHKDGLSEALKNIIATQDGKEIITEFKNIILRSYGKRSEDGKRFIKTQEMRDEFESTEAYSTLFMDLIMNVDSAVEFINGIIPQNMVEQATKVTADLAVVPPASPPTVINRQEVMTMGSEELAKLGEKLASGEVVLSDSV